ncbi:hypothetical protein RchiOBHm_Chr1g0337321 [Rosa chinensis]|uniref:Uncharacterized protein n=1 Tax=Rosa chinensis TaxID=74649 RepID=A0A2P6SCW4_ROSCH|nr:hypothetical protein RchiOBHm_Chr1g0337321 [Rosa chinensis]
MEEIKFVPVVEYCAWSFVPRDCNKVAHEAAKHALAISFAVDRRRNSLANCSNPSRQFVKIDSQVSHSA